MPCLGLDTATSRGSVALGRAGEVLAERPLLERAGHARDLLGEIDRLLREAALTTGDLTGIGVAVGPGSFTGIRVGMATAKGLAYALRIGVVGISTLEAIARAAQRVLPGGPTGICAAIGAGRGEIYAALFRVASGALVREAPDRSLTPEALITTLPEGVAVVGDAAASIQERARERGRRVEALEPPRFLAGPIALWACGSIPPGTGYRPGTLGPNYVRPSDAEIARRRP